MEKKSTKFKLKLTKFDILIILSTFFVALTISLFTFFAPTNYNENELFVAVYYNQNELIKEPLICQSSDSDPRYIILFKEEISDKYDITFPTTNERKFANNNLLLDDLIIKIDNQTVSIIKETSPNNICSLQGDMTRVNIPLVCAPNYVTVIIKSNTINEGITIPV